MANIVIKDLMENVELDREAMRKVTGGQSIQRLGIPALHSNFFKNPHTFNELKLLPDSQNFSGNSW